MDLARYHRLRPAYYRLEGPGDAGCIGAAYRRAQSERGPAAVIVGAPTS